MAKKSYIGVADKAEKVKKIYIGVDGVARKVKAAYVGVNGVAKKVFSASPADMTVNYTGNYTDEIVTMGNGLQYRLLTLTSSGVLTLESFLGDVWLCGGGFNGQKSLEGNYAGDGGNGANFNQVNNTIISSRNVTVAAREGISYFGDISSDSIAGAKKGTGAYIARAGYGGSAAAQSTQPFNDTYFTKYPCAGGGGGGMIDFNQRGYGGGSGGSSIGNGENGDRSYGYGGAGGVTGGGKGGGVDNLTGKNGSYYGAGAGGGALNNITDTEYNGGKGYQGVVFVRIPLEQ